MDPTRCSSPTWILVGLTVGFTLMLGASLWDLVTSTEFGEPDFKIYWSAAYLLSQGENPYDVSAIQEIQASQTDGASTVQIMAWNPPYLFLVLLPLAWLPFLSAKFAWLVINITILVTAAIMLMRIYLTSASPIVKLIFILFALGFPAALTGLYMGQVTFLVFWGLTASLILAKKERWFWAGAALILTSIKPHLVVLPVLYLLVSMAYHRKFKGWAGLATTAVTGLVLISLFRSDLIAHLLGETSVAAGRWATSTIGGLLSYLGVTEAARYLIFLLLPLPILLAIHPDRISMEESIALLTLLTVPTTIFGWSYDQTILLIPIAQIFSWISRSPYKHALIAGAAAVVLLNYVQRVLPLNEVFYVWVPLAWGLIFALAWRDRPSLHPSYA